MSRAKSRICVLKGGWSVEREISLTSGADCATALRDAGYEVREIDVDRNIGRLAADLSGELDAPSAQVVFNALHGRFGEDGCIQALLNMLDIPYTHSGVQASATAMDKVKARAVFAAAGITVAHGLESTLGAIAQAHPMAPPYVIKPINEGSSVGVRMVRKGENARHADGPAHRAMLVERYIPGAELTVAVMGDGAGDPAGLRSLGVTEIRSNTGFFDYDHKTTAGITDHLLPAPIPDEIFRLAEAWAKMAHSKLGCRGVSRADFRFDSDTFDASGAGSESPGLYMLEVNTQPGMTPVSLVPEQAAFCGIPFTELVTWLVERAACD